MKGEIVRSLSMMVMAIGMGIIALICGGPAWAVVLTIGVMGAIDIACNRPS